MEAGTDSIDEETLKSVISKAFNATKAVNRADAASHDFSALLRTYSEETPLLETLFPSPGEDEDEEDVASPSPVDSGAKTPNSWDVVTPPSPQQTSDFMDASLLGTMFEVIEKPPAKPQDILIMTIGSRGDIQPFISLAIGLQKYGHRVRLAGFECFRSFVEQNNIEFFPLAGDPKALMKLCVDNGMFSINFIYEGLVNFRSFYVDLLNSCWDACIKPREGDKPFCPTAIISNPPVMAHYHLAEALRIPLFIAFTMPWSQTTEFPQPMLADREWGSKLYNKWTFKLMEKITWFGLGDIVNKWRTEKLHLPPIKSVNEGAHALRTRHVPHIYCYSEQLCPRPKDWNEWLCVTNFWFLDEGSATSYVPPPELARFLAAGPPPIYIGFGSIPTPDPDGLTKLILNAGRRAKKRLLVAKGWGGITDSAITADMKDSVFFLEACPHDWLFPQMEAVVHHGGAGTLAAGLRAGRPTAIVAFFGDQYFWGPITEKAGVGVWTQSSSLTEDWLTNALEKITCPDMKENALRMSKSINEEDGVSKAVEFFNSRLPFTQEPEVTVFVCEHETYSLLTGWKSSKPKFTDLDGKPTKGVPDPFLPISDRSKAIQLRHGQQWTSPWSVHHEVVPGGIKVDANGWQYSTNGRENFHPVMQSNDYHRRRKWARTYTVATTQCDCPACSGESPN